MWRRWRAYLIGVAIGFFIVYFMLIQGRDRDFSFWLPSSRVLSDVSEYLDTSDYRTSCLIECHELFPSDMSDIWENGDVDFASSTTGGPQKVYRVLHILADKRAIEIQVQLKDTTASIIDMKSSTTINCDCDD